MPGKALKFRCYQCNQLLGVSRNRAGGVVPCPKCGAELVVPEPSEIPSPTASAPSPAQPEPKAPSRLESFDFGPEDIRSLVDVVRDWPKVPEPPSEPEPPVPLPFDPNPEPAPPPEPPEAPAVESEEPPETSPTVAISEPAEPIRPPEWERRRRDVVLPRTVAVAWSLFVIIALLLAFLAGLLAGHYVWIEP